MVGGVCAEWVQPVGCSGIEVKRACRGDASTSCCRIRRSCRRFSDVEAPLWLPAHAGRIAVNLLPSFNGLWQRIVIDCREPTTAADCGHVCGRRRAGGALFGRHPLVVGRGCVSRVVSHAWVRVARVRRREEVRSASHCEGCRGSDASSPDDGSGCQPPRRHHPAHTETRHGTPRRTRRWVATCHLGDTHAPFPRALQHH